MNKKTIEEYEEFKRDVRFYGAVLVISFSVIVIVFAIYLQNHQDSLDNIECGMGIKDCDTVPVLLTTPTPNPLEGWEEGCYDYSNAITYNFTITYFEVNSPKMEAKKSFIVESHNEELLESDFPFHYQDKGITYLDSFPKAIDYHIIENKTVCIKKMLVKEVSIE